MPGPAGGALTIVSQISHNLSGLLLADGADKTCVPAQSGEAHWPAAEEFAAFPLQLHY